MTIVMAQQGWQCPNCGNIISPNMMWCPFCSGEKKVTYTTTTSTTDRKTEPQTDIHDLTDCDFCKDRNCKDCEGGKDEPQIIDWGKRKPCTLELFDDDGNYIEPKDKPQTENPCDGCVCDDGKHLMYCMNCKGIAWKTEPPKIEDEPQTELKGSKRLVKGSEEETEIERLDRIDSEIEDAWARIRELTPLDETQTDCAWR